MDKKHNLYVPGNKFEYVISYKYIDKEIGKIVKATGKDTVIILVSHHGAKRINGAIAINDWLIKEGHLSIKNRPKEKESL